MKRSMKFLTVAAAALVAGVAASTFAGDGFSPAGGPSLAPGRGSVADESLDAIAHASGSWLTTPPLSRKDLRGKVVLVNFWTYSCINSLRTLPWLKAWHEKYADQGLVIVGVHSPEFAFEKDEKNVRTAAADLSTRFPVVMDNDFAIWRAFDNNAWPGFYFIDANGRLRGKKLGEEGYEKSEELIRELLAEANGTPVSGSVSSPRGSGAEAAPDWKNLATPETYVGYGQARNFASDGGLAPDVARDYRAPQQLAHNSWSLDGAWRAGKEFTTLNRPGGRIQFRFQARDLHLVLAPSTSGKPVRYRIRIDGKEPGGDHGVDVDAAGIGTVRQARMYQLVRQSGSIAARTFEIEFLDAGVRAYAFTFG